MTKREFFTAVAEGTVNADVIAVAKAELEKFAAEDKERDSKRAANQELALAILGKMEVGKEYFNKDLVALGGEGVNSSKVTYLIREFLTDKLTIKDTTPKTYIRK